METAHSVLIIDDSEDDVDCYRRLLHCDLGVSDIRTAETGSEGIAAYQAQPSQCVLLDYHLPGQDGLQILRSLKAIDPYASIVMLTGQMEEEVVLTAFEGGASDFVVKDTISPASLRSALLNAAEKTVLRQQLHSERQEQQAFMQALIHDVKAPLRHISQFSDFLRDDMEAGAYEQAENDVGKICRNVRRMNALFEMIASYVRLQDKPVLKPVRLDGCARDAMSNLAQLIAERGAKVSCDPLPTVEGDHWELVLLFQHLIANGIIYNSATTPSVEISALPSNGEHWLFCLKDNGAGIPPDRLPDIFAPFKRLCSQDKIEGSGLGLTICRMIVDAHGGTIWCESEPSVGSRFYFTFPRMEP